MDAQRTWQGRIVVREDVLFGKPFIRGTPVTVVTVLERLAAGWSVDDVLAVYPALSRDDVLAALTFAAEVLGREEYAG